MLQEILNCPANRVAATIAQVPDAKERIELYNLWLEEKGYTPQDFEVKD